MIILRNYAVHNTKVDLEVIEIVNESGFTKVHESARKLCCKSLKSLNTKVTKVNPLLTGGGVF
jgi:hypothetical protein